MDSVAGGLENYAPAVGYGRAQHRIMSLEGGGHLLRMFLPKQCAGLDVGEEEGVIHLENIGNRISPSARFVDLPSGSEHPSSRSEGDDWADRREIAVVASGAMRHPREPLDW
jgi:hypothetical protein